MRPAIPYLTFPGTCREAVTAYAEALGGAVTALVSFREAPIDPPGGADPDGVFDAEVRAGDLVVKASDDPSLGRVQPSVSVFLTLDDEQEMRRTLASLAAGGTVLFPPEGSFGMVEDRFGVRWMATVAAA